MQGHWSTHHNASDVLPTVLRAVPRIFKQDNASGCLNNDQLVVLWSQERLKLLQLFTPTCTLNHPCLSMQLHC